MPLVQRSGISKQRHLIPDSLSHSGGIITAVLSGVSYSHTLSGLTANTLYFLYMRINSGNVILTSSTSIPSVYRVSFPEAILVGAFYADGMSPVAFGSFVNIEGAPESLPISYTPVWTSLGTNPTLGTTSITGFWTRKGAYALLNFGFQIGSGFSPGTSTYLMSTPTNIQMTSVGLANPLNTLDGDSMFIDNSASNFQYRLSAERSGATAISFRVANSTAQWAASLPVTPATSDFFQSAVSTPILAWSNTPLKDL
ncbi:MAG: hypothetical protein A4S09_16350 [Proteobacteria bacterium SG_bin7]|nr:MAG: hypothetical protein A4S09_16350 [Proteobacteria bacterium SG_bin7]